LETLLLTGGVWKDQKLTGNFRPLASLERLRHLTVTNVRGPVDLSPLLGFEHLESLHVATDFFPVTEIARLGARYEFWRNAKPWLRRFQDSDGCSRCGASRVLIFLPRKKRLYCETCDAVQLRRRLDRFDALIRAAGEN
jgi:ribosomal protein S27AE